jgi:hypothetical protein
VAAVSPPLPAIIDAPVWESTFDFLGEANPNNTATWSDVT